MTKDQALEGQALSKTIRECEHAIFMAKRNLKQLNGIETTGDWSSKRDGDITAALSSLTARYNDTELFTDQEALGLTISLTMDLIKKLSDKAKDAEAQLAAL